MATYKASCWVSLASLLLACAPAPHAPYGLSANLRDPAGVPRDMTVRQHIAVVAMTEHGEEEGAFDAVLQKHGGELLVIGLGPAGVRTFVLRQTAAAVTLDQRFGSPLPFAPERIVLDIHRVFFRCAQPPPLGEGMAFAVVDGDSLVEHWTQGQLVERRLVASDGEHVVMTFGPGCTVAACRPASVTLTSETRNYRLSIANEQFVE